MHADERRHERECEQRPVAQIHHAEHDRQPDEGHQEPIDDRAHRPPKRRRAARVVLERRTQLLLAEVGPERVHEHELCVGELPEQEVRDAELARRTDEQIRIRHLRLVEVRAEALLVDLLRPDAVLRGEPPDRLDDLRASAVVERDPQVQHVVLGGLGLEPLHPLAHVGRDAVAPADEPRADALRREIGQLAVDRLAEDLHQVGDLVEGRDQFSVENA